MIPDQIPWELLAPLLKLMAANPEIAAASASLLSSWFLYGVLGKRYLGADDDYWPWIRGIVLPILDQIGSKYGFYAAGPMGGNEFAGIVDMDPEQFERRLERMGYYRNPLSAYKESPQGWESDGSWAKRTGKMRGLGDRLRKKGLDHVPILETYVARFLQAFGDVFAVYQIHITMFNREDGIHIYAHHEFNSLNPITAFPHYTAVKFNPKKGKRLVRADFEEAEIPLHLPTEG